MTFELQILSIILLIGSAILHEIAHGYVADRLGDPTARLLGRLTLNPLKHIDPIMSIAVPIFLRLMGSPIIFAAAKPVPIDPFNLKEGRKDIALVALSGPLTNIILAIISAILLRLTTYIDPFSFMQSVFFIAIQVNIMLATLNLLPIPPLDGSKIFSLVLPEKEANIYMSISSMGIFILFFLLAFPVGGISLSLFLSNLNNFIIRVLVGI